MKALRENGGLLLSLVAVSEANVVGGVAFSPLDPGAGNQPCIWPDWLPWPCCRRISGKASAPVSSRSDCSMCREKGLAAIFLVGEPNFYGRFGFRPAMGFGIRCEFEVPDAYWLALELRPGALPAVSGLARYRPEFQAL